MKSNLLTFIVIFFIASTTCDAQYISSTVLQSFNPAVYRCSTNQSIIRVEIEIGPTPVTITSLEFNTNFSSNPLTDIINSKLYFYNDSSFLDLNQATLIGTYNPTPFSWATNFIFLSPSLFYSGMNTFNGLVPGKNYFWLTYDIHCTATLGNSVGACFVGGIADGLLFTSSQSCPAGFPQIDPAPTGLQENLNNPVLNIYPVPTSNNISIDLKASITKPISIELLDITGKKIDTLFEGIPQANESVLDFSVAKYPSGIYLIRSSCEGKVSLNKISIL